MNCSLTDTDRRSGMSCRSFNCTDCRDFKKEMNNTQLPEESEFEKYREQRLLKECPMCSDLYHGYKGAWYDQQKKIDHQDKIIRELIRGFDKVKDALQLIHDSGDENAYDAYYAEGGLDNIDEILNSDLIKEYRE